MYPPLLPINQARPELHHDIPHCHTPPIPKKEPMHLSRILLLLSTSFFLHTALAAEEARSWTDAQGNTITGTYISSTEDSVTIKRAPDGQAFRLKLIDCKPEEKEYVAKMRADAREAESFDATVSGQITWRLPIWNNLSWSNKQPSELWIWDEKNQVPLEKVATLTVDYDNSSKRNEFFGTYKSDGPIHLWKPVKYVIKGKFSGTVNGEQKTVEQTSTPFLLPTAGKDGLKLNIIRFTLTR